MRRTCTNCSRTCERDGRFLCWNTDKEITPIMRAYTWLAGCPEWRHTDPANNPLWRKLHE